MFENKNASFYCLQDVLKVQLHFRQKITGVDLEYRALIGKPCEITYRYAEHVIGDVAKKIGINKPIEKLYFIG